MNQECTITNKQTLKIRILKIKKHNSFLFIFGKFFLFFQKVISVVWYLCYLVDISFLSFLCVGSSHSEEDLLQISRPFFTHSVISNYYTIRREELSSLAKCVVISLLHLKMFHSFTQFNLFLHLKCLTFQPDCFFSCNILLEKFSVANCGTNRYWTV